MAELRFTEEDERLIETLGDFDPAKRLGHLRLRDMIPAESWAFLIEREAGSLRYALKAALITAALGVEDNYYDIRGHIVEGWSTQEESDLEYVRVKSAVAIFDMVPLEVAREFEDAVSDLNQEMSERIFKREQVS